jgi:hypothetical protein
LKEIGKHLESFVRNEAENRKKKTTQTRCMVLFDGSTGGTNSPFMLAGNELAKR